MTKRQQTRYDKLRGYEHRPWKATPSAWLSLPGKAKLALDTHQDAPRTSVKAPVARRVHKGLP